jgi:hypothetical protein
VQLIEILAPATHRVILSRMLRNLNGLYAEARRLGRAARSADRILRLSPETPTRCAIAAWPIASSATPGRARGPRALPAPQAAERRGRGPLRETRWSTSAARAR